MVYSVLEYPGSQFIENWSQSVLGVCETPGFAEFSPFFGYFPSGISTDIYCI